MNSKEVANKICRLLGMKERDYLVYYRECHEELIKIIQVSALSAIDATEIMENRGYTVLSVGLKTKSAIR